MVNPFAKRRKEAIAAAIVSKEDEPKKEKPEQAKQENNDEKPVVKKVNPFLKKKQQAKKEEEVAQVVDIEPNPDEDPALLAVANEPESEVPATKPKRKSRKKKEEPKQEEPKEEKEEEEEKQEEPAPEETTETAAEAEAETTEEPAPETEKKAEAENDTKAVAPKKTKKVAKKDPDQRRAEKIILSDYGDIFKSDLSVEESAKFVLEAYQSDEFRTFKKEIYARMEDVTIDPDMNPGTIRYKLHCIDALKMELMPLKVNTREALNSLMQKDYGVLTAYIAEHSVGSNDLERRRNGCLSLAKFECKGQQINMLTTMTGVKMRDEFLDAVLSELKTKQEVLITYLGTLKVDSNLMPPDIVPER